MIVLLAASSITLAGLQATINAPRDALRACLKQASNKATGEKVEGALYEAYVRNACSGEVGSLKGAVVKFDMGNKMSRKASDEDADSMISDFVASAVENYKYLNPEAAAPAQKQAAGAPATAPASLTPPQPTPASQPK